MTTTVGVPDREAVVDFKEAVLRKYGKLHGHLGEEIVKALRMREEELRSE